MVSPKARSAGVWLKPSKPKDNSVLNAETPTASQAAPSSLTARLLQKNPVVDADAEQQHERQQMKQLQPLSGDTQERQRQQTSPARWAPTRANWRGDSADKAARRRQRRTPAIPSPCSNDSRRAARKFRSPDRPKRRLRVRCGLAQAGQAAPGHAAKRNDAGMLIAHLAQPKMAPRFARRRFEIIIDGDRQRRSRASAHARRSTQLGPSPSLCRHCRQRTLLV